MRSEKLRERMVAFQPEVLKDKSLRVISKEDSREMTEVVRMVEGDLEWALGTADLHPLLRTELTAALLGRQGKAEERRERKE